jgi:hypothetical protein
VNNASTSLARLFHLKSGGNSLFLTTKTLSFLISKCRLVFQFTTIQTNYFTLYPNLAIIFWATVEPPSNLLPPPFGVPCDMGGLFCFSCKDGGGAMAAPPDLGALGFGASSSSSLSCLPAKPLNLLLLSSLMYLGLLLL